MDFKKSVYQYPTTLLRIGLFKNIELRLISQFVNSVSKNPALPVEERSVFGIDNLAVGTKINIYTEKGLRPEIAVLSHLTLPTGSEDFQNEKVLFDVVFSFSHTLSERLSLGYNLGWATDDINKNGNGIYTFSLGYGLTRKFGVFAETFGELENLNRATLGLDGGFTYLLKNNIQFDISGGSSLTENSYFFSGGFSVLFSKFFKN